MRSSARLLGSLEAPQTALAKSLYVCSTCRQQFLPRTFQLAAQASRRNASGSTPFTEKVRRKIWGTDNPPGLKDPYGGQGVFEQALRQREQGGEVEGTVEPQQVPSQSTAVAAAEDVAVEEVADNVAPDGYVPATTWDDLERVGMLDSWWERPPTDIDQYNGFMASEKLNGRSELLTALHQIVVELSIAKSLNKPLKNVCHILEHDPEILATINQVEIEPSNGNQSAQLSFPDEASQQAVFSVFERISELPEEPPKAQKQPEAETAEEAEAEEIELEEADFAELEAKPLNVPSNQSFLSVQLGDAESKFAFLKRTAQVTGHRIPDHLITSMTTVNNVLAHLVEATKEKPKKLAEKLAADPVLAQLPNVKIFDRRQTPIDEEMEVGRWKIIEEELTRRGLPLTGRA